MTIYWVRTEDESALGAIDAVDRAIAAGDIGAAPAVIAPVALAGANIDDYLAEYLDLVHAAWSVDPNQIMELHRPGLSVAANVFQRLVRRATWWYTLPQWLQANQFHGAVVRLLDSLLNRQRQDRARLVELEALAGRVAILERRLDVSRIERAQLRRRIAELESRLASQTHTHDT
jgi:hypothetical protein